MKIEMKPSLMILIGVVMGVTLGYMGDYIDNYWLKIFIWIVALIVVYQLVDRRYRTIRSNIFTRSNP